MSVDKLTRKNRRPAQYPPDTSLLQLYGMGDVDLKMGRGGQVQRVPIGS